MTVKRGREEGVATLTVNGQWPLIFYKSLLPTAPNSLSNYIAGHFGEKVIPQLGLTNLIPWCILTEGPKRGRGFTDPGHYAYLW